MGGINTPADKREATPQNPFENADLSTKDKATEVAAHLVRKLNSLGNSVLVLHFLKEVVAKAGPGLKLDDANELVRAATVVKNDTAAKFQNKKKKDKGKATIKAIGDAGAYDDYDYDDY